MLDGFSAIFKYSITPNQILANISVALICSIFISISYRKTYSGPGYLISFANALILLSLITSIVIMIIGNNLARAFGLVGAMSIIRFRTAVKETHDIVYIFFALTIGMASGVGLHSLAIIGTIFVGIVSFFISKLTGISNNNDSTLLEFNIENSNDKSTSDYQKILGKYSKKLKLTNIKSIDNNLMQVSYYIKFRKENQSLDLVKKLQEIEGVNHISLFSDNESF